MVTRVLIRDIAGNLRMLRLNARDARASTFRNDGELGDCAFSVVTMLRRNASRQASEYFTKRE
jgi:hypothetical protein